VSFISCFYSSNIQCQITESDWEKVIITRNSDDVKGFKRAGDVSATTSIVFGTQSRLREETTVKVKKAAARLGASIVLVQVDNFTFTPINNVNMVGVAYFQEMKPDSVSTSQNSSISSKADDLVKLKGLLDKGIITQAEYDQEKKKILDRN
jgi:hypothetical protein